MSVGDDTSTTAPKPLFVLGIQRSGTTWLANILSAHPRVVSVQAEDHFGVHESIFFSHFARQFGDLESDANFAEFAAAFSTCDYYLLTGLEPEWLRVRRPRSYPEAFDAVMGEVARRRSGATYWLEKSPDHTLLGNQLATAFPDAKFVCILRDPLAVIRSHVGLTPTDSRRGTSRKAQIARLATASSLNHRWLGRFARTCDRSLLVRYEDLLEQREETTNAILDFLELQRDAQLLQDPWERNTSFDSPRQRRGALTLSDRVAARAALLAASLIPIGTLADMKKRRQARHGVEWPDWCWRRRDAERRADL